ncbi:MAG: exodeoxyribonuclease VII large subunit [Acidobacteriota bacterium]
MHETQPKLFQDRQIFSVSQIVHKIKVDLETGYRNIWVRGEVSNFRTPPSGHLYFTLKDGAAQIRAVCFRMQSRYLKFLPEDGMAVVARGSVSVYPPRGDFQLIVEFMEPVGRGALQAAFEQLKSRLEAEGLFDAGRKKQLPLLPSKIGVVTSPSGAAIQDILRVLKRRNNQLSVLICPAKVQGREAAREIAGSLHYLNNLSDIDVIIVGRGGGSWEDLWAFNEEPVARAISRSSIPVLSAVGHETDFTIADFVADIRAATPSAAAELVCLARGELWDRVQHLSTRLRQAARLVVNRKRERLHQLSGSRAFMHAHSRIRLFQQHLDDLWARLVRARPDLFGPRRKRIAQCLRELEHQTRFYLEKRSRVFHVAHRQLQAFSPLAVLDRGYAIVTNRREQIVRHPDQVADGELIEVRVAGGRFPARKDERDGG